MTIRHVVVDGSNIATEGRTLPSLAQLDEAVRSFQKEFPDTQLTIVVDASFGHRIDESERALFEQAEEYGEVISPPAGAIGRGDAFLLQIADRIGAMILSNDSFQEFHGDYEWLFEKDRLIGGKPVPGVGWIFTPRNPVRGKKSREATANARRHQVRVGSREASQPMPVPKFPPPVTPKAGGGEAVRAHGSGARPPEVAEAIAAATKEAISPEEVEEQSSRSRSRRRRRKTGTASITAVNEPLPFIRFIAEHQLGSVVTGEVAEFTSHGAFIQVGDVRAYVPLSGLADPPPRRARDVLTRGEMVEFVLQALDPARRGIELARPQLASLAGSVSDETLEEELKDLEPKTRRRRASSRAARSAVPDSDLAGEVAAAPGLTVPQPDANPESETANSASAVGLPAESVTPPEAAAQQGVLVEIEPASVGLADPEPASVEPAPDSAPTEPAPKKPTRRRTTKKAAAVAVVE